MVTPEVLYAVMGVLFHEAVRIYKAVQVKRSWIPPASLGRAGDASLYGVLLLVFSATAALLAHHVAGDNEIAAFLFGVGVPSGGHLVKPESEAGVSGSTVDDMWQDDFQKPSFKLRAKRWLTSFYG